MKLTCDCGCRKELQKVHDSAGKWHGQYRWYSSSHDKAKRFLTPACIQQWESRRKTRLIQKASASPFLQAAAGI
jgi:hypothetical protein